MECNAIYVSDFRNFTTNTCTCSSANLEYRKAGKEHQNSLYNDHVSGGYDDDDDDDDDNDDDE